MFLQPYFNESDQGAVISAEQASRFAKDVAQDFNPIHDPESKRFCVPGDLLFAMTLMKFGLSEQMEIQFQGMVGKETNLLFPDAFESSFELKDDKDKTYLSAQRSGETNTDAAVIERFIRHYVSFSGHNFTDVVLPLMKRHEVMVNPARPLVIYDSMGFEFDTLNLVAPKLELIDTQLDINGKRGDATLLFAIVDQGKPVGKGKKTLVLSGLRPLCNDAIEQMCQEYALRQQQLS
ncbi:DUF3581 family protein [Paraferrimonas haliotis]|uniref:DUF3581 family protein n=1 Tax=Paraferrimonas haliotis TaxID=2013866 RepID=A0AA37WYQ0_9GAMM|nr:DUF3581 family protein [Paraferrimonas haliotis]GLS84769.1 hypothetical protein GCM10007894_27460 [Paraferrimonas haliotis]